MMDSQEKALEMGNQEEVNTVEENAGQQQEPSAAADAPQAEPAGAQDEAVSIEEMCTGFRQQYLETERYRTPQGFTSTRPVVRLDTAGYDRVYFGQVAEGRVTLYGRDSDGGQVVNLCRQMPMMGSPLSGTG